MSSHLSKKQTGGPTKKSERLNNRSERVMGRAQKNWSKAQKALDYDETKNPGTSNAVGYASQKLNQAARQETRAKNLKDRAKAAESKTTMKKGGSVKKKK